jgi:hypothetical protein
MELSIGHLPDNAIHVAATRMLTKYIIVFFHTSVQVGMLCVHTNKEPPLASEKIQFIFWIL